jgi:hypothetical protein
MIFMVLFILIIIGLGVIYMQGLITLSSDQPIWSRALEILRYLGLFFINLFHLFRELFNANLTAIRQHNWSLISSTTETKPPPPTLQLKANQKAQPKVSK